MLNENFSSFFCCVFFVRSVSTSAFFASFFVLVLCLKLVDAVLWDVGGSGLEGKGMGFFVLQRNYRSYVNF